MKIIAVVGDYYHDETNLKEALTQVTDETNRIDISYTKREKLIEALKEQPDLVVLGSENRLTPDEDNSNNWMSESDEQEITTYVSNGGSWFAWHSGLANYRENSSYTDMVGGYFTHHPEQHVDVSYQYVGGKEVGKGKEAFKIKDEHYFINHSKDISIFLKSVSPHGESIAGWTKTYGEGKVCAYIPAHNREGLKDVAVQKDLKDILIWLSK